MYEKWAGQVMSEFFAQGRREAELGMPVIFSEEKIRPVTVLRGCHANAMRAPLDSAGLNVCLLGLPSHMSMWFQCVCRAGGIGKFQIGFIVGLVKPYYSALAAVGHAACIDLRFCGHCRHTVPGQRTLAVQSICERAVLSGIARCLPHEIVRVSCHRERKRTRSRLLPLVAPLVSQRACLSGD